MLNREVSLLLYCRASTGNPTCSSYTLRYGSRTKIKNTISAILSKEEYLIDTTRAKAIQSLGRELQSRIENGDNTATFSRFCEDLIFLLKSLFDNVKSKNCSNSKKENSCGLVIIRKL